MRQQRHRGIGLALTGIGVILVVISFFLEEAYWPLLIGTIFVLIGLIVSLLYWRGLAEGDPTDKGTVDETHGSPPGGASPPP